MVAGRKNRSEKKSSARGQRLLRLARETIGQQLGIVTTVDPENLDDPFFIQRCGTFVTLKINNRLRGCIGNLEPQGRVVESVRRNAISAAFHDHRFSPLTPEEFTKIQIDISILTEAKAITYRDGDDLVSRLRPGVDGVILQQGRSRATFLPQVWEQVADDPCVFLNHLCLKAGLPEYAWRDDHPDVFVYRVTCFEEEGQ